MTPSPLSDRRRALIASLRQRFTQADARGDAETKQALFQEAAALNLPPELWHDERPANEPETKQELSPPRD